MEQGITSVIFGIVALLLLVLVRAYLKRAADLEYGAKYDCGDPHPLPSKWPLGLDLIVKAFGLAREGRILQFFVSVCQEHGPTFEQNLLGARGVNTTDPRNLEAILSTQFDDFDLGERPPCFFPLLGDGIFTQVGSAWKHSRELLRPQFLKKRAQIFDELQSQVENLIFCISPGVPVDLQPLFFRLTLDTTTFLLFGQSINSLTKESSDSAESSFAEAFRVSQDYLARRGRLGLFYWMIGGSEFNKSCAIVHEFIDQIIQEHLKSTAVGQSLSPVDEKEASFLEYLIRETRDPQVLRDQLLNVLLAGRDTTACCLSWTFRLLSRHQEVLTKLRDEINSVVGTGINASPPSRNELKRMPYLDMVLKEVLRLYPSVPVNSRSAVKTTTIPTGGGPLRNKPILVRKGEAVGYCVYAMHRRKDLYGDDAEYFRPERWESNDLKNIGWGYLPFNGGPRICLGQDFALLEAAYATVRLLQSFPRVTLPAGEVYPRVTMDNGTEKQELTLVLASGEGCWVEMRS